MEQAISMEKRDRPVEPIHWNLTKLYFDLTENFVRARELMDFYSVSDMPHGFW